MKNRKLGTNVMLVMMTALLSLAGTLAFAAPMKPELAAKKQNYERQKAQQITPEKRKAAAEALKAERIKIYEAKQAALKSNPGQNKK